MVRYVELDLALEMANMAYEGKLEPIQFEEILKEESKEA